MTRSGRFYGGATAEPRADAPTGTLRVAPDTRSPGACPAARLPLGDGPHAGYLADVDLRDAGSGGAAAAMRLWCRIRGHLASRPALLGFVADYVPLAVLRSVGVRGRTASLDNTVRIGADCDSEWILVDIAPDLAAGGYGHRTAYLWSDDARRRRQPVGDRAPRRRLTGLRRRAPSAGRGPARR